MRLQPAKKGSANTLVAACPNCRSPIDLYGVDAAGKYHRLSWFMRSFAPRPIEHPLDAWLFVLQNCSTRGQKQQDRGAWKTAEETYRSLQGDRKDAAVLLADWLAASGYDAKAVVGEADGELAAWVVLHADEHTYILDPAGGRKTYRRTPPRAELMTNYVPRVQFDHTGVWLRRSPQWTSQYADAAQWWRGPWPAEPLPSNPPDPSR